MQKSHKIRWRDSDVEQLARKVKNYNAKLSRELKKNPEAAQFLPEKISLKEIKKTIATRKDLNRQLEKLSDFMKRNSTQLVTNAQGETATIFEIEQTKKNIQRVNAQRRAEQKRVDNMPVRIDGQEVNVRRMAQRIKNKPIKFDFDKSKKGEFSKFAKYVESQMLDSNYFVKARQHVEILKNVWTANYSRDNYNKLCAAIDNIAPEKILEEYYRGVVEFDPEFHYRLEDENVKVERTLSEIRKLA